MFFPGWSVPTGDMHRTSNSSRPWQLGFAKAWLAKTVRCMPQLLAAVRARGTRPGLLATVPHQSIPGSPRDLP